MESNCCSNVCATENNDKALFTSGDACLDFFTRIVRNAPVNDYLDAFTKAWGEDKNTAVQLLLNMRDARNGKGEKLIPVVLLAYLRMCLTSNTYEDICREFVKYGYWKDILRVMEISLRAKLASSKRVKLDFSTEVKLFAEQLKTDTNVINTQEPGKKAAISLCAKWAPSENTHYDHHPMGFAKKVSAQMGMSMKEYRQMLSTLRNHIGVLEMLMSTQQYDKIDFSKLPSVAHRKLRKAFLRETNSNGVESDARKSMKVSYQEYLQKLTKGEVRVNVKGTQPHELVTHYLHGGDTDALIDGQWNALMERVKSAGVFRDVTAVVDVSSSMSGQPMEVAIALGLLVAKCTEGPFHGQVITFHSNPSWFRVVGNSLKDHVNSMRAAPWGGSTNMRAVFDLILQQAKDAKLKQDEMVKTLFIFTDMQFDSACNGFDPWTSTFEDAKRTFENAGYRLPNIVCWNLRTSTAKTMPVSKNEEGFVMLSGFSSELLKCILTGQDFSPLAMMRHVLEPYVVPLSVTNAPTLLALPMPLANLEQGINKSVIKKAFKQPKNDTSNADLNESNTSDTTSDSD